VRPLRLLATASVALAALVAAPAAVAHAELVESRPADGAVVKDVREVVLRFSEPVETALGTVRVSDPNGRRVDDGDLNQRSSREVAVGLRNDLPRGVYLVSWQVISADGHPVHGAFAFHVGEPGGLGVSTPTVVDEDTGSAAVDAAFAFTRFLVFALILLCLGGALVLAAVVRSDDGVQAVRRRLFGALALAAGVLVVVSIAGLPLQAASAGGIPLRDAAGWDSVSAVLETRFGQMWAWRAWLALTIAVLALAGRRDHEFPVPAVIVAGMLAVTPAAAGHAGVSGALPFVSDVAHVVAAGAWAGGLAFLVAALVLARTDRWRLAARAVPRFSSIAVVAVAVLVVAGVTNGYFQVREWRGLWETTYGLLLVAKVALVVPVLALGAYNNRFAVRRLRDGTASPREQRRFLHTAAAELVVLAVVVGVTAVLVNEPPPRTELEPQRVRSSSTNSAGEPTTTSALSAIPRGPSSETTPTRTPHSISSSARNASRSVESSPA
jgi:copper transport protein